jgi:hypothetical protein
MVLDPILQTNFKPSQLHLNAYRTVNGRPYQRWFKPNRSDVKANACSSWTGCEDLIEPRIEEFNSLQWIFTQQAFIDEWAGSGYESVVFAERPGSSFQTDFQPFSEKLFFVLLAGKVTLDSASQSDGAARPLVGEQVQLKFNEFHSVKPIGDSPAAWAYIWPWPRNMTLNEAMQL